MRKRIVNSFLLLALFACGVLAGSSQTFRVGEKLSYSLSLGSFKDGGYAELYVASKGKMGNREAVELRSRIKTIGVLSASFVLLDENRTVFADPSTGMPMFVKRVENQSALPREYSLNFLTEPSTNFDLTTLIYRVRASGGTGSYTFFQGDHVYTATFTPGKSEHLKVDAGDFDTTVINVQSEFLATHGLRDLRINLSTDEQKIPILLRARTQKTEFRATLSALTVDLPAALPSDPTTRPTPIPEETPIPIPTPRPQPTAKPYVENQELAEDLGFRLGERLSYRISQNDQSVATIVFEATERKQFEGKDSLLLTVTVTGVQRPNGPFRPGDSVRAQVDPETLAPQKVVGNFGSTLTSISGTAAFDPKGGVSFGGAKPADAPFGTHSLLSLFYAIRSFNLQKARDNSNPINDTRVAVFYKDRAYIFTLRPAAPGDITLNGRKISAQEIAVTTQDPQLDALGIKIWLQTDTRVPLRISAGGYQADLIS